MSRGRKGTGVRPRNDNIEISFQFQGSRCAERINLRPTPPNLKYAVRLRAEIVDKIENGNFEYAAYFPKSTRAAVNVLLDGEDWLFRGVASKMVKVYGENLHESTRRGYLTALRKYWLPRFGDRDIRKLDAEEVAIKVADIDWDQISASTRNNYLIAPRAVFKYALTTGKLMKDPTVLIKNRKPAPRRADPLSVEEMDNLLAFLRDNRRDQIRNYIEFAIFAGLRPEEQIELKWGDIDFRASSMRIERAFALGLVKETKTGNVRDVELNDMALAALHRQKQFTFLADRSRENNKLAQFLAQNRDAIAPICDVIATRRGVVDDETNEINNLNGRRNWIRTNDPHHVKVVL